MATIGNRVDKLIEELEKQTNHSSDMKICNNCGESFNESESNILIDREGEISLVCPYCNSSDFE